MRFGLMFANTGPFAVDGGNAAAMAQGAEQAGFDSLWAVEHVVVPAGHESKYPYSEDGRMPGGEDFDIPDPLIWLAYVAAHTTSIKLATGILILPQRNPAIVAKECATLDRLSGGRLILGIGIGWLREEFEALGVRWEARTARTEEYAEALRCFWTEREPTFSGQFTSFERAKSYPKPTNGTVPIVVGGHTEAAARRAGRVGDGFFPANADPEAIGPLLAALRDEAAKHDRDSGAIEITVGGFPDVDAVERLADEGIHRVVVPSFLWEKYAEDVVSKLE